MCGYVPPQGVQPRIRNINQIINRRHADLQQLYIQDHSTNWRNARDFPTVQSAINDLAGAGIVYIPVGTFNENLVLANNDVTLQGSGWGTIIDGGISGDAIQIIGVRNKVQNLQAKTTVGGGKTYSVLKFASTAEDCLALKVFVNGADEHGIYIDSIRVELASCHVYNTQAIGIYVRGNLAILTGVRIRNTDGYGIRFRYGDDSVLSGFVINTTGDDGIFIDAGSDNNLVDSGRIKSWTNEAIDDDSGTSTIGDVDTT